MNEITYGFVDENNVLSEFAVVNSGDTETLTRLIELFNASAAYPMNLEKETTEIGATFWNGTRFVHASPFPSWIWTEEENRWKAPVDYPTDPTTPHEWDEESQVWAPISVPNEELWSE